MNESRSSDYILGILKNMNLITVIYISGLMSYCLSGYIRENSALAFMGKINVMPIAAWKIPLISVGLYCCCLLFLYIQNVNNLELFFKVFLELGISFCISYVIGFSYTGIVLLVLADAMRYFPKSKWKFSFAIIICLFYMLTDYNLISVYFRVTPLETYLEYFQNDTRAILMGIKNALVSLNVSIFLV